MNIEELQAKVEAAQKANAERIKEAVQVAALGTKLALESNENLFNAKVKLEVRASNTRKLQSLVDECAKIVESVPVFNPKTRANREWNGSMRFAYGSQINLMYQLASGILFSCTEHKQLLLAHTGLNIELIEQFVEAFGTPTYYSRNFNTIVEAKEFDVETAINAALVMQSVLGVEIDTSLLTKDKFLEEFSKAEVKAQLDKTAADVAITEAELEI